MSDNGKTFIGAKRATEREFLTFLKEISNDVVQKYALQGINWKFIPPGAPHMGGLWESAVKSFKAHLKKIAIPHKFTFEEFITLLVRIEAVLKSRPISPLSQILRQLPPATLVEALQCFPSQNRIAKDSP